MDTPLGATATTETNRARPNVGVCSPRKDVVANQFSKHLTAGFGTSDHMQLSHENLVLK